MTDRISHLVVGLAHDVREDDIDEIVTALRMVKGVLIVEPQVSGDQFGVRLERERFRLDVQTRLYDAVNDALRTDR